jgi:hypothetical protein
MKKQVTKNYTVFLFAKNNRPYRPSKHRDLYRSMQKKGFDPDYPIDCYRNKKGELIVVDGQHRLNFAKELGLPVYYRIVRNSSAREFNRTMVAWDIADYISSHIGDGNKAVAEMDEFRLKYGISPAMAEMLLAGRVAFIQGKTIKDGNVQIKNRPFAEKVASTISAIKQVFPYATEMKFVTAIARFCCVPEFVPSRLIEKIRAIPGLLVRQPTVNSYATLLADIYNRSMGSKSRIDIKFLADEAMRKRNPAKI